jgi:cold-inducible RNA-binding protein
MDFPRKKCPKEYLIELNTISALLHKKIRYTVPIVSVTWLVVDYTAKEACKVDTYFFLFSVMGKRLFVGNLPYRVTAEQLREIFSQNGEVVDVFIPLDRETRRPRGFALVEMSTDEEAAAAITAHNGITEVTDDRGARVITVNEARPKEERPAGGGFGGGRPPRREGGFNGGGNSGGDSGNRW